MGRKERRIATPDDLQQDQSATDYACNDAALPHLRDHSCSGCRHHRHQCLQISVLVRTPVPDEETAVASEYRSPQSLPRRNERQAERRQRKQRSENWHGTVKAEPIVRLERKRHESSCRLPQALSQGSDGAPEIVPKHG